MASGKNRATRGYCVRCGKRKGYGRTKYCGDVCCRLASEESKKRIREAENAKREEARRKEYIKLASKIQDMERRGYNTFELADWLLKHVFMSRGCDE